MDNKQDSNIVGLHIAEEASLKVLPGASENEAVWYELEPNSYADFGGNIKTVARSPINASRQKKKGTVSDIEAAAGFNVDLTQTNSTRHLQGFFFADAREKTNTQPLNGSKIAVTGVTGSTKTYSAASGLAAFKAGHLVMFSGFGVAANNGLDKVASSTATTLVGTATKADEASPPAAAKAEVVGFEFPSADVAIVVTGSTSIRLTSAATNLTTLGLTIGEWVFIGGDATGKKFATCPSGYARISAIASGYIDFDDTTFAAVSDTGTGKTIQMFFGTVIRNEKDSSLIKRRSYQLERQLGYDNDGMQSEYVKGAIANELTVNIPQKDKINIDLSFVPMDFEQRTGAQGLKAGTRVAALGEDAYNTSSDIYRTKLSIVDPATLNPSALFGYVSETTLNVKNNVSGNGAIGVLGSFDATAGNFEVSGSLTAYFTTVAAVQAVRNNADVAFNVIAAQGNAGFVIDVPLLALGGGRLKVEKDKPVTVPLEQMAAENPNGYTLLSTWFSYLPALAMPD